MVRATSEARSERASWIGRTFAGSPFTRPSGHLLRLLALVEELLVLRRAVQCGGRGLAGGDHLRDVVEVAGADLALVFDRGEAVLGSRELLLLHFHEGGHAVARVAV